MMFYRPIEEIRKVYPVSPTLAAIAAAAGVSPPTVENIMKEIMAKLLTPRELEIIGERATAIGTRLRAKRLVGEKCRS